MSALEFLQDFAGFRFVCGGLLQQPAVELQLQAEMIGGRVMAGIVMFVAGRLQISFHRNAGGATQLSCLPNRLIWWQMVLGTNKQAAVFDVQSFEIFADGGC